MRTEIAHHYKSGFFLSEQELRRIVLSCQEHAPRIGVNDTLKIRAKLKDGTLVDSQNVDDILALENGGRKAITRLTLVCDDDHENPKSYIKVEFQDGLANPASWDAASVSVVGESRDAAFVAAADLDDRVKKTQVRAWPYIVSTPGVFLAFLIVAMFLSLSFGSYFSPSRSAADHLQSAYEAGQLKNAIQAIIELERFKSSSPIYRSILAFAMPLAVIWGVVLLAQYVIPKVFLSYVFY